MSYATLADARAYSPVTAAITDDDELQPELDQAERDIDRILRLRTARNLVTGLRIDTVAELAAGTLEQWQVDALTLAVCAQVEYRLSMGADFFIRAQHRRVSGPDFTTEGELPYIGPKAIRELQGSGLARSGVTSVALTSLIAPVSGFETLSDFI